MAETQTSEASFLQQLQTLWSIESMLVEAMPRMIEKAGSFGLKKMLALHFAETDQQKVAIQAICKQLGFVLQGEADADLKRIVEEGETEMANSDAADEAIIASARKIEHYEIGRYNAAAQQAEALGYSAIAKRLYRTLEEERQAETKLKFVLKNLVKPTAQLGGAAVAS